MGMGQFDQVPHQKNVRVVGYTELNDRPAFKMSILEVNGSWFMYVGHLWHSGWSIIDVTDPSKPEVVKFIPGPANTWTIQMELAGGKMITSLEQISPGWGGDPGRPFDEGVFIWELRDPVNPRLLGQWKSGGKGTHRNFYAGGPYVHLAATMPGYEGAIYVIIDISNPAKPVEVSRWWVPGQHLAGKEKPPKPSIGLHGPPYVQGNLAFLPYGSAGMVIADISDIRHPKFVGQLEFSPPFNPRIAGHSVLPLPKRNLAIVLSEAIQEDGREPLNHASIVDISDLANPYLLSLLPVPAPPPGAPYRNFCEKGGRFGPHNLNHNYHNPFVQQRDDLLYVTYFNAGLRIFDITDPRLPVETGYFLPPNPKRRYGPKPERVLAAQSEDVLVDARGTIYVTDKNQGIWILRYVEEGESS